HLPPPIPTLFPYTTLFRSTARAFARKWLETHHDALEAGFVLPPLLDQTKIGAEGAAAVVENAVKWLQTFYETTDAEFVLKKLFRDRKSTRLNSSHLVISYA